MMPQKVKELCSIELGLLVSRVFLLVYLAVVGSEAAQARIPFIVTALDVVATEVGKRREASEQKQQEKRPARGK